MGPQLSAISSASCRIQELDTEVHRQSLVDFEACAWVPLAEWVLGTALSSTDGREAEARAVLEKSAARAPGTWIATSLTQ